MGALRPILPV